MLESRLGEQRPHLRIIMPKVRKGGPAITDGSRADGTLKWPKPRDDVLPP